MNRQSANLVPMHAKASYPVPVCLSVLLILAMAPSPCLARGRQRAVRNDSAFRLYAGGRYHTESSVLTFLPYKDGDVSATVGVELRDAMGYWQLLLNGMERPGDDDSTASRILTPQVHMVLKDRAFLAGVGMLRSHIRDDEHGTGWTRMYFQLKSGLEFELADRLLLSGMVAYPFKRWDALNDFKASDLEYSVGLSFRF